MKVTYRIYAREPFNKADYIVESLEEAEDLLSKDRLNIVKVFFGRCKSQEYRVRWQDNAFKYERRGFDYK